MQFRTKARAVDLLGKGQIADLPTAITELWKNGYDAYADKLKTILYTEGYEDVKKPLFILSDDGKGMSYKDIEDKWLILGTDSKSRGKMPIKGEETLYKEPRPIMGEKGIGRLSVAYLGSPMLMLTKKIGKPLQALYFDWRTLENYNLFLEDVQIPIVSITNSTDFEIIFESLKRSFLCNFIDFDNEEETKKKQLLWEDQKETLKRIIDSTKNIELPNFFVEEIVNELIGDSDEIHGTKFVIFEPDEQFLMLKKWSNQLNNADDEDIETVEDLRTGLIGFYNEFKYNNDAPIDTTFIIKDETGERDFIGSNAFFTEDDFNHCDHLINGEFDKTGIFTGKIRVYKETLDYTSRLNKPIGTKTSYGSFKIKLGIVPGINETLLEENVFRYYDDKIKSFGGLYIYRDNLRVLPYGRPHSDFLQFEERRSRRAGSYFFSYRRMFGFIDLTRENNKPLSDKAGREGFINNKAYRDFKTDLTAFFIKLAKEYYGTDAKQDVKQKQLDEMKSAKATFAEEKKLEDNERRVFKESLKKIPSQLDDLYQKLSHLQAELSNKISETGLIYQDIQYLLREIDRLKVSLDNLKPQKPKRFSLDSRDRERFEDVCALYDNQLVNFESIKELRIIALNRIEEEQLLKEYENRFQSYISLFDSVTEKNKSDFKQAFNHIDIEFNKTENTYRDRLEGLYRNNIPTPLTRDNFEQGIQNLELEFSNLRMEYQNILDVKSEHLLKLNFEIDDDALVGLFKDRYEKVLKELGDFKNLAQLGIAAEIINHELNSMYTQLSTSIIEVQKHLKSTNEAEKHFKYLRNAFEHLDSKYQSLNPFYRKSKRTKRYIRGTEIKEYMSNFFEETFKEEKISFNSTMLFDESETYTFDSVLFPVFINVINNAVYWLRSADKPQILLDYEKDTKTIIICNNGSEIRDSSLNEIFDLFYTRRPKGRGIGLYLSKDGLNTVNLDIKASNNNKYNKLNGASFIIFPF